LNARIDGGRATELNAEYSRLALERQALREG
jgi:hypothetical protein